MEMRTLRRSLCVACLLTMAMVLSMCSTGPVDDTLIAGKVAKAADSTGIADANVIIYNANTNAPVTRVATDSEGAFSAEVIGGSYYLEVSAQGYEASPPPLGSAIPFQALGNTTTERNVYLDALAGSFGSISGTIATSNSDGVGGMLVIAVPALGTETVSGTTGPDGHYVLHNIAPGTYTVYCYRAGYAQDAASGVSVSVVVDSTAQSVDVAVSQGASGTVSGQVSFIATNNPDIPIDVTLIHPDVREAIPGLSTEIGVGANSYSVTSIPVGTYIVWASYRNDGYVMDPDRIQKFGLPVVTLTAANSDTSIDFGITGAVQLTWPTNAADALQPLGTDTLTPEFSWAKTSSYSSVKEFILEVFDGRGNSIWGGYDANGAIRHSQIPSSQTSAVFNFDGSAGDTLLAGGIYRWKVYADDDATAGVQTLLSASEDQLGLFKVVSP